jgi:hypothetical protein
MAFNETGRTASGLIPTVPARDVNTDALPVQVRWNFDDFEPPDEEKNPKGTKKELLEAIERVIDEIFPPGQAQSSPHFNVTMSIIRHRC